MLSGYGVGVGVIVNVGWGVAVGMSEGKGVVLGTCVADCNISGAAEFVRLFAEVIKPHPPRIKTMASEDNIFSEGVNNFFMIGFPTM